MVNIRHKYAKLCLTFKVTIFLTCTSFHGNQRLFHHLIRNFFDRDLSQDKTRKEQGTLNFIFIHM